MARQKHHPKQATAAQASKTAKKPASVPAAPQQEAQGVASEQRDRMIAEADYLIAEQRGFEGDMALNEWLQAEAAVDARFAARH